MDSSDLKKLKEPFPAEDIEWRIGRSGKTSKGIWAKCLAYVTNRAIQDRLDAVCGPENWKDEYVAWKQKGQLCGISIRIDGEWITKWDGADDTDFEPTKGGLSNAEKRAAVKWGIGRYLYGLDEGFAEVSTSHQKGWRYAKLKKDDGGDAYYWMPPSLPDWAVPQNTTPPKTNGADNGPSPLQLLKKAMAESPIDHTSKEEIGRAIAHITGDPKKDGKWAFSSNSNALEILAILEQQSAEGIPETELWR